MCLSSLISGRASPPGNSTFKERDGPLQIVDQERLTSVESLYRVALDTSKQYAATNLMVTAEDLVVTLESGSVFVARLRRA